VTDALTGSAESGVVGDDAGSPNLLLNLVDYDEVDCDQAYEEYLADGTEIPAGEGPAVPSGLIGFVLLGVAVAMVAARRGQAVTG